MPLHPPKNGAPCASVSVRNKPNPTISLAAFTRAAVVSVPFLLAACNAEPTSTDSNSSVDTGHIDDSYDSDDFTDPEAVGELNGVLVEFPGPNGITLTGRLFKPAGTGPFPATVGLSGCSGLYYDDEKERLGSPYSFWGPDLMGQGVVVLFVDSFTPRGIDEVCDDPSDDLQLNEATERPKDAYAGLEFLKGLSYVNEDHALIGWSNGGSATLSSMALNGNPVGEIEDGFDVAIAEYPGCGLRGTYGDPDDYLESGTYLPYAPMHLMVGSADTTTPPDPNCYSLVTRAEELGASDATGNPVQISTFDGAQHGYDRADEDTEWTDADRAARDQSRLMVKMALSETFGIELK